MTLKGYTAQLLVHRTALIDKLVFVVEQIVRWATVTDNTEVLKNISRRVWYYKHLSNDVPDSVARDIHTFCNDHASALTDYGITPVILSDLNAKITTFESYKNIPREKIEQKAEATRMIDELVPKCDLVLKKKMDVFSVVFKPSNPEFYGLYLQSRRITNGQRVIYSIRGKVTDQETNKPIREADVYLREVDLHLTTSRYGAFSKAVLPNGPVNVVVNYPGYQEFTEEVMIFPGETAKVMVGLVKI